MVPSISADSILEVPGLGLVQGEVARVSLVLLGTKVQDEEVLEPRGTAKPGLTKVLSTSEEEQAVPFPHVALQQGVNMTMPAG